MKIISTVISASVLFGSVSALIGGRNVTTTTRTYTTGLRSSIDPTSIDNFSFCGGTLISPIHVLTAASCNVKNAKFVSVGAHYLDGGEDGDEIMVTKRINHPQFSTHTLANDFAILTLKKKSIHKPVKLPAPDGSDIRSGMWATAMGWGLTSAPPEGMASVDLLELPQQVITNQECRKTLGTDVGMAQVCAFGEKGNSTCQGDTGGPLIIKKGKEDVLIGVISGGYYCGMNESPALYGRVSSVLAWINSIMKAK